MCIRDSHHLLPILTGARPDTTERTGYARLLLINVGGLLTLLGANAAGLIMMGIGLAANVIAVGRAIYLQKRPSTYRKDWRVKC